MGVYTVIVKLIDIEAENHDQAAMKAVGVLNEVLPNKFEVRSEDFGTKYVALSEEEMEKACEPSPDGRPIEELYRRT